jgi:hypothetical protein
MLENQGRGMVARERNESQKVKERRKKAHLNQSSLSLFPLDKAPRQIARHFFKTYIAQVSCSSPMPVIV